MADIFISLKDRDDEENPWLFIRERFSKMFCMGETFSFYYQESPMRSEME